MVKRTSCSVASLPLCHKGSNFVECKIEGARETVSVYAGSVQCVITGSV